MARSWTRAQIRTRARFHADLENADVGVLDARVNELLDVHKCNVYLELVNAGPPDYYSADFDITTSSGVVSYSLPADFLRGVRVMRVLENGPSGPQRMVPMTMISGHERGYYTPPQGTYSARMEYIPAPPIWTSDSDTFDGIAGYEEAIAKLTARDMLGKESSNDSWQILNTECMRVLQEIRSTAKRSVGAQPITNVNFEEDDAWYWSGTNTLRAFRWRASAIELLERRVRP